ncbi:MAG: hypothetical protein ACYTGN_11925 [Planctomycetota bacterium]|jgi:hypothetical protein
MNLNSRTKWLAGTALVVLFVLEAALAGPVTVPNTFQANTPAVAAEVNANFDAVATAINDNDTRIGGLGTRVDNLESITSEDLGIFRGVVKADRTVHAGTGFSVSTFGTGNYVVDFSPTFSGAAAFAVTPYSKDVHSQSIQLSGTTAANISFFDSDGAAVDSAFSIIAIGPR